MPPIPARENTALAHPPAPPPPLAPSPTRRSRKATTGFESTPRTDNQTHTRSQTPGGGVPPDVPSERHADTTSPIASSLASLTCPPFVFRGVRIRDRGHLDDRVCGQGQTLAVRHPSPPPYIQHLGFSPPSLTSAARSSSRPATPGVGVGALGRLLTPPVLVASAIKLSPCSPLHVSVPRLLGGVRRSDCNRCRRSIACLPACLRLCLFALCVGFPADLVCGGPLGK